MAYILAIDQGTTSSRAALVTEAGELLAVHQIPLTQQFPHPAWVEQDPEELWSSVLTCCQEVLRGITAKEVSVLGISNQRETTLVWDKTTGQCLHAALVWQDRRAAADCLALKAVSGDRVRALTGLRLDAYFSAIKLRWLLREVPGLRQKAEAGELLFGTVDAFLIWRLTKGKSHVTDATNASRTLLYDIHRHEWSEELLSLFEIPRSVLPQVLDSTGEFGSVDESLLGAAIPITGVAGDQQAALVGQACFEAGMAKSTYGTGCFVLLNTGERCVTSQHQLLSTIAYQIKGRVTYGLEGSIFNAGTVVQWLRDKLHLIDDAKKTESIANSITDTHGVYLVPAFTGLGAPYWNAEARGALIGLTRDTGIAEVVRAGLESVCYQTRDLLQAMSQDATLPKTLRVDGGMVLNNWLMQFLADMLNIPVERPMVSETSVLGAAMLAALGSGLFSTLAEISHIWHSEKVFTPILPAEKRETLYQGWQSAVRRVL